MRPDSRRGSARAWQKNNRQSRNGYRLDTRYKNEFNPNKIIPFLYFVVKEKAAKTAASDLFKLLTLGLGGLQSGKRGVVLFGIL